MATPAQPPPPPSDWLSSAAAGRKILYTPEDAAYLSEPLCILRAQIEAFAATQDDIKARAGRGGMKRESLAVGRVGIRCIHCSHLPLIDRARGAVSYPKSVQIMYQAVRNFQRYHFLKCEQTPAHVKKSFQDSRGTSAQSKKDAQDYWISCCESMGMVDTGTDGGIRFGSGMLSEHVNNGNGGTSLSSLPNAAAVVNQAMDGLPPRFTAQEEKQELATVSPTEIARAEADLRGIISGLDSVGIDNTEDEDWRTEQLYHLDTELATIPVNQKTAYLEAVTTSPEMVNDGHKIAFLEREGFNAKLAAGRLVRYWKTKLTVFGPEKCFLPLTLRGAMKDEVDGMLKHCPYQLLPVKDTAGRAIILHNPSRRDPLFYSTNSMMMAIWYIVEAAAEDPEVRKNGFVFLMCPKNVEKRHFDPAMVSFMNRVFPYVSPVACRSFHMCHPSFTVYYVFYPISQRLVGRESRLRSKMHYGTEEKVLRELESFCLPRDRVPAELGGDVILDIEKWVNDRLLLENQRDVSQDQDVDKEVHSEDSRREAKRMRITNEQSTLN